MTYSKDVQIERIELSDKITERIYECGHHLLVYANKLVQDGTAIAEQKNKETIYKLNKDRLVISNHSRKIKSQFPSAEEGGLEIIGKSDSINITLIGTEPDMFNFTERADCYLNNLIKVRTMMKRKK